MGAEDLEIENIDRIERLLIEKHGKLSVGLTGNIDKIRQELVKYEIDEILLNRIASVFYNANLMEDVKDVEEAIRYLFSTFYDQIEN